MSARPIFSFQHTHMYILKKATTAQIERELRQSRRDEADMVKTLDKWRMEYGTDFQEYRGLEGVLGVLRQYIQRIESALEPLPR